MDLKNLQVNNIYKDIKFNPSKQYLRYKITKTSIPCSISFLTGCEMISTIVSRINELWKKVWLLADLAINRPTIQKVIDNQKPLKELAFSFYVLWICVHAFAMHERNVFDDNEWTWCYNG
jgi:hypothetical protein